MLAWPVSWLCGIEEGKQLATHPLRGNLFENLVLMEALKYRYNQGKGNNLYFYRDSNGNEIDILYTKGQDILPIEVRSGQTITPAYFSGLKKFSALFPECLPWQSLLVYGGEVEQLRQDIKVIRLLSLAEHLEKIDRQ